MKLWTGFLTLLILVTGLAVRVRATGQDTVSILKPADVPGFYLHQSVVYDGRDYSTPYKEYNEVWNTLPKNDFDTLIRRGGTNPHIAYRVIFVHRYVFTSASDAKKFVDAKFLPRVVTKGSPYKWRKNSPSGRKVGNESWFTAVDPYDLPPDLLPPTENLLQAAKLYNQDSLKVLFVVNRTVTMFFVEGTVGIRVNRTWAEGLARKTAAHVRRQNGGSDDPEDDDYGDDGGHR